MSASNVSRWPVRNVPNLSKCSTKNNLFAEKAEELNKRIEEDEEPLTEVCW